jgi:hypothetical protein
VIDKEREEMIAGVLKVFSSNIAVMDLIRLFPIVLEFNILAHRGNLEDIQSTEDLLKASRDMKDLARIPELIISSVLEATNENSVSIDIDQLRQGIQDMGVSSKDVMDTILISLVSFIHIIFNRHNEFFDMALDKLREDMPDEEFLNQSIMTSKQSVH